MVNYRDLFPIIGASFEELKAVATFLSDKEDIASPTTVLIGGWAVHHYNAWYGSIDIDLITSHKTEHSLKKYLIEHRGFIRYKTADDSKEVKKILPNGTSIMIDFGRRDRPDPFEGMDSSLDYRFLDGNTLPWEMETGVIISVPFRTELLMMKMKAAWDREYRVVNNTSHDRDWELDKLKKDRGDILALIDPQYGGREIRLDHLGDYISRYPFLLSVIESIKNDRSAIERYGRMDYDIVNRTLNELTYLVR